MGKFQDLTGQKFGRLVVVQRSANKNGHTAWLCKCECGKNVNVLADTLKRGRTKSCGCFQRENMAQRSRKHGQCETRLYNIWRNMNSRCSNKKNTSYSNYGGRGVSVCDEWKNNFVAFYVWANNNGYNEQLTLDRIDVNDNYCPENCRWITLQEQQYNKTVCHYIEYNGKKRTIAEWAKALNISYDTLWARINKLKWPIEKAMTYQQKGGT